MEDATTVALNIAPSTPISTRPESNAGETRCSFISLFAVALGVGGGACTDFGRLE